MCNSIPNDAQRLVLRLSLETKRLNGRPLVGSLGIRQRDPCLERYVVCCVRGTILPIRPYLHGPCQLYYSLHCSLCKVPFCQRVAAVHADVAHSD